MDNKKFEQLITLITNENEEQARALFHDIVVEKSREIYESMMDEEGQMGGQMGGQVGDLLDEINTEEEGISEEDEDLEDFGDEDDEEISLDSDEDEFGDEEGEEEDLEDRVVSLEDKLDELMAEFEELMADEEGEEEHNDGENDPDFGGDEGADDFGGEEDFGSEEEAPLAEAVALQNVKGLYGSNIGGDNGSNAKSIALTKPKVVATGANPVKFSGASETVPSSPKAPSNYGTKGETQVKGAGSFKNSPGQKKQDGEAAPKPTTSQASGVNTKSTLGESRRTRK